jgi:hypothetical protein
MNHPTEQELTLHFYGDSGNPAIAEHLAGCAECRQEFQRLSAVLAAVTMPVPEPVAAYESEVWSRLRPRLESIADQQQAEASVVKFPSRTARPSIWTGLPRWAGMGAVAAVMIAAFFFGRLWERRTPVMSGPGVQNASTAAIRNRVLLMAVGEHLDRTAAVLVELENADPAKSMDISWEQSTAQQLLDDNRLYRQTALEVNDKAVADVLDQLERVLVDLTHQPSKVSESEFNDIRRRLQAQGILLKVRVIGSQVRDRERESRSSNGEKQKT